MKIIKDIEQGSEEWLRLRLGKATASNFDKIITSTGKESATLPKYALELASELLILDYEEGYKSDDMQRGNDLEQEAREAYEQSSFNQVDIVTFIDCGDYGCSPDGLIANDGSIEIKCPNKTTHTKYLFENRLPVEYVQQVQGVLMISGREWCDFVSYHPNFNDDERVFTKRIYRNEILITELKKGIEKVIKMRNDIYNKIRKQEIEINAMQAS